MSSTEGRTSTDEDSDEHDGPDNEEFRLELIDAGMKQIHAKRLAAIFSSIEGLLQHASIEFAAADLLKLSVKGKAYGEVTAILAGLAPFGNYSPFDEIRFDSFLAGQSKAMVSWLRQNPAPFAFQPSYSRMRGGSIEFMDCHGIEISNFKGFSDRRSFIPIRPLTLIYGPNNSGKSSILKALGSFSQSHHKRVTDDATIDWSPIGNWFDLGESPQILHDPDGKSFRVGYIFRRTRALKIPKTEDDSPGFLRVCEDKYLKIVFEISMDQSNLSEQGKLRSMEFWKGDSEDFMRHKITLSPEIAEPMRYGKSRQDFSSGAGPSRITFLKEGDRVFRVDVVDDEIIEMEGEKSRIREKLLMEILSLPDVNPDFGDALIPILNSILGRFSPEASFESIESAKGFAFWPHGTIACDFIGLFWASIFSDQNRFMGRRRVEHGLGRVMSEAAGGSGDAHIHDFFKTHLPSHLKVIESSDWRVEPHRGGDDSPVDFFFSDLRDTSPHTIRRFSALTLSHLKPLQGQAWDFSWNTGIAETAGGTPSYPVSFSSFSPFMGPSGSAHRHKYLTQIQWCFDNVSRLTSNADYLSATRLLPLRLYSGSAGSGSSQGLDGSRTLALLADDRSALKEVNEKLEDMIGIRLKITRMRSTFVDEGGESHRYPTNRLNVRVLGPEGDTKLQLPDIGFGASQVLPILSAARTSQTVIVEEPESNLHPAAQAKLMSHIVDLTVGRAHSSGQTRPIIMETHSEHFLLSLLDEISNPECPITDDDVAIIYVEKKDGATQVRRMETTGGALDQEFPDEFSGRTYRRSII